MRGPVSFVRPPDITYTDRMQIALGGKRVDISQWDGFDWVPLNVLGMYHFLTDSR